MVKGADWPAEIVAMPVPVTPVALPVPLKPKICGLPAALSVIVKLPGRVPSCAGVKVTVNVQVTFAAMEPPQLLVWLYSALMLKLLITRGAPPTLVMVKDCPALGAPISWLSNESEVGANDAAGGGTGNPIPANATFCVEPLAASSVMVSVPPLLLSKVGVKTTLIVQKAATGRAAGQLLVWEKFPVVAIELMFSAALPLLVSVTGAAGLEVPTMSEPKLRSVRERTAPAPVNAEPFNAIVWILVIASSVSVKDSLIVPVWPGLKTTFTVQLVPPAREVPQSFVWLKSSPTVMEVKVSVASPLLVIFTLCGLLLLPVATDPNVSVLGANATFGAGAKESLLIKPGPLVVCRTPGVVIRKFGAPTT